MKTVWFIMALFFSQIFLPVQSQQAQRCQTYPSIVWMATSNLEGYIKIFETLNYQDPRLLTLQSPLDSRSEKSLYRAAEFCPSTSTEPLVRILAIPALQRLDAHVLGVTHTFSSPNVWRTLAATQAHFAVMPKITTETQLLRFVFQDGEGNALTFEGTP